MKGNVRKGNLKLCVGFERKWDWIKIVIFVFKIFDQNLMNNGKD